MGLYASLCSGVARWATTLATCGVGLLAALLPPGLDAQTPADSSRLLVSRCVAGDSDPLTSEACRLVLRFIQAQEQGELWPDWRRLPEFRIPEDAVLSNYAVAALQPLICGAKRQGDLVTVAVQFGELGAVEQDLGDGHWSLVTKVQWRIEYYRMRPSDGRLQLLYSPYFDPRIGVAAALRRCPEDDKTDLRADLEQAEQELRRHARPPCPA